MLNAINSIHIFYRFIQLDFIIAQYARQDICQTAWATKQYTSLKNKKKTTTKTNEKKKNIERGISMADMEFIERSRFIVARVLVVVAAAGIVRFFVDYSSKMTHDRAERKELLAP